MEIIKGKQWNPWNISMESHGILPWNPWQMSMESLENVHGFHGKFPWKPGTFSRETCHGILDFFHGILFQYSRE